MNRSIRTTGGSGATHYEDGYALLMQKERTKTDYAKAISLFDKAIMMGFRDPRCYESKITACFRLGVLEETDLRRAKRRKVLGADQLPDGSAHLANAFHGALAAIKRMAKQRWQPWYLLAEYHLHKEAYAAAQKAIDECKETKSYLTAKPAIIDKVDSLAKRIWADKTHLATRKAGRTELGAIARELHLAAEIKKTTDYTSLLQDDVWILIARYANAMDHRMAARLELVNRRLHGVMTSSPGLWNRLTVGAHKKTERKVDKHIDICGGEDRPGLLQVIVDKGSDRLEAFPAIQDKLRNNMANVRDFDLTLDTLDHRLTIWRHKLPKVARLSLTSGGLSTTTDMTFGLVPPDSSTLRELSLSSITLQPSPDLQTAYNADRAAGRLVPPLTIPNAAVQLANIRIFAINMVQLPQALVEYIHAMPKLETLSLRHVYTDPNTIITPITQPVTAEHLHTVELHNYTHSQTPFFQELMAPNIRTLELVSMIQWHNAGVLNIPAQLQAPGLIAALPNLTALELFRSQTNTIELLPILERMPALRYLGLAFTGVANDFVQALVKGKEDENGKRVELLPKLEALSIAGMYDLNAADLRDLVCAKKGLPLRSGKLVDGSSQSASQASQKKAKSKGLFGATQAPRKSVASSATFKPPPASAPPRLPEPKTTPLRWLNTDHCQSMDYTIVDWLQTQIGFVSANMEHTGGIQDRMTGKGQWDWQLDRESCGRWRATAERDPQLGDEGYTGPCGVVEDKAAGKWLIKHTCGVYIPGGVGYIARSSQQATSSQAASQDASQPVRAAARKKKPTVEVRRAGWGWGSNLPHKRRGSAESSGTSGEAKRARED